MVYADDLICSINLEEHRNKLSNLFKRLKELNVTLKLKKRKFLATQIKYLRNFS